MSRLALIPARQGSKRIPHKNILSFMGHPMLAYAVVAARESGLFSRVVVSTDSAQIGEAAEWYGAEYLPRPAALASDEAGLVEVALHALEQVDKDVDELSVVMPNCPLRSADDIVELHKAFIENRRAFQISAVPYRGAYPQWAITPEPDGRGRWLFSEGELLRSQDLAAALCPTGAVWWVRVADFRAQRTFYGDPFHIEEMDANRGFDIDDPEDLRLAEILVHGLRAMTATNPLQEIRRPPSPQQRPPPAVVRQRSTTSSRTRE